MHLATGARETPTLEEMRCCMRIGIATWHEENYGSILQAYATSAFLKELGHDPVFLRYDFSGSPLSKFVSRVGTIGAGPAISQCVANVRGRLFMRSHHGETSVRNDVMQSFIEKNLVETERLYTRSDCGDALCEADVFLCGSDQIWNPAITCFSPFYWLSFVPSGTPKISYAPSMGKPKLKAKHREFVVSRLNELHAASVREKTTADMLNELDGLNKYVETVVDPTLLLPKEQWESLCKSSRVNASEESYVFAYILRGSPEQREFAARLAKNRNLKLIVYPYLEAIPQGDDALTWGDERVFDDDPADFLARIRNASLVITDSFHCTVFSILFKKDFYVLRKTFDTTSQTTRIDDLLSVAGLEGRILERMEEPNAKGDFAAVETRLAAYADKSRLYLTEAVARAEQSISAKVGK